MNKATALFAFALMAWQGPALGQPGAKKDLPPPQDLVQQDRLMATLRELPTSRAALGDEASREGLRKTEASIARRLTEMGYRPTMQEFNWALPARYWPVPGATPAPPATESPGKADDKDHKQESGDKPEPATPEKAATPDPAESAKRAEHTWHNIIVDIPGREAPGEVVLIGAHFDAVPGAPGADDNGSGTAALLEVARVLKDHPTKKTIRLVFFNLEECGLVGSTKYVHLTKPDWKAGEGKDGKAAAPKEKIVGMVSLEMLGYFSDQPNSQKSPLQAIPGVFEPPTVGDTIAVVGLKGDQVFIGKLAEGMRKGAPELKLTVVDFLPFPIIDMTRSDHRPFMLAGIPAVMITDTANFRNPNYHQPTDTIETIDMKRYTLVVRAVAAAAYGLAEPDAK